MSGQLSLEGGFQGFPLYTCIKIVSVLLGHHILKLLDVSNQVKLRTKVNRERLGNLKCQDMRIWTTVLKFVRMMSHIRPSMLVVVMVPVFSKAMVMANTHKITCPGSLEDQIAAEHIMTPGCGPHTHHAKVCPDYFFGMPPTS